MAGECAAHNRHECYGDSIVPPGLDWLQLVYEPLSRLLLLFSAASILSSVTYCSSIFEALATMIQFPQTAEALEQDAFSRHGRRLTRGYQSHQPCMNRQHLLGSNRLGGVSKSSSTPVERDTHCFGRYRIAHFRSAGCKLIVP